MESVHCTITGLCLHMHHRPSARTLQHVTVLIHNIYRHSTWYELHPLRLLVTSVPGDFVPLKKDRNERGENKQGPKCLNHFGTWNRSAP